MRLPALYFLGAGVLLIAPGLIGIFWGAPLVTRELEAGTFRLVWNQSVTRTRWMAVKLALTGLAAMATAGLLSLMITWWASPIDRTLAMDGGHTTAFDRLDPLMFGARGITPIGYAAFAFVLGVTAGVLIRRTLPAIFTALTGYIAVLFLVVWRYPSLMTPLTAVVPFSGNQDFTSRLGANILVVHRGMDTIYDASGHAMNRAAVQSLCPVGGSDCTAQHHLMEALRYQPGSRIPDFHLILACDYFALGAIAVAVVWWLARRTSLSAG